MPTSADVRIWGARQEPALAKPSTRGRLSKKCVDAYNLAYPSAPYETDAKPVPHILPVPPREGVDGVQDVAEHAGTVENPSSAVEPVSETSTERRQDESTPFTSPAQAGEDVTGEQVRQFNEPATDDDYSDGSDYDVTKSPNVHYVNFSAEPYEETP